jgi:glycosyltransferase involved in cell wall biosynthesis
MVDFSIVTAVKNSDQTILRTINSVAKQNFKKYEHIVVCHFKDIRSRKILKNINKKKINLIISKDNSLYEAMNIGIKNSKGGFVTFLNADDVFKDKKVLENVKKNIVSFPSSDSFYGNIEIVKNKQIYRTWTSGEFSINKFFWGWHPPHPSLFIKRKIFKKYGYFDLNFNIAADYELMIRYFVVKKISSKYIKRTFVKMAHGGLSSKNIWAIFLSNFESLLAWKKNGYNLQFYIFFIKPFSKIIQFLR